MAFQKLEQDVPGFQADTEALARKYMRGADPTPADIADAGAKVVGRYVDGTPAVAEEAARQGKQGAFPNDFDLDNVDAYGVACPFHAHVRRMNPRHALNGDPSELSPRIARRGIPYGTPDAGPNIGLLFMSMQARLSQFDELLMDADQKDFPRTRVNNAWGTDTIIGRPNALVDHHWRLQRYLKIIHRFERHVTFLGGGYFHFPSMAFWGP